MIMRELYRGGRGDWEGVLVGQGGFEPPTT
jgi:hypothetical protein